MAPRTASRSIGRRFESEAVIDIVLGFRGRREGWSGWRPSCRPWTSRAENVGAQRIQRVDSALRLDPHFHTIALDGAYVRADEGDLVFHALPEPSAEEVAQVAAWTHASLVRVLARHGRSLDGVEEAPDPLRDEEPALASCYAVSAADVQLLGDAPGQRTRNARLLASVQERPIARQFGTTHSCAQSMMRRSWRSRWKRSTAGFGGGWCIPELFAHAFEEAVHGLSGEDFAAILAAGTGAVGALGWMPSRDLRELEQFVTGLRHRERRLRYLFQAHPRLRQILGKDASLRARRLFVLAKVIDDIFDEFPEDATSLPIEMLKRASARPPNMFDEIENAPPPLGQMTPIAICRSAFSRFWYTGNVRSARVFGPIPAPLPIELPYRTAAALRTAVEDNELRLAAVGLPVRAAPTRDDSTPGRFAVTSMGHGTTRDDLVRVVSFAGEARAHILLLSELALLPDDVAALASVLAERDARFPALTVAGVAHCRPGGHPAHLNEAVVLTSNGRELFRHEKLEPFSDKEGRFEDIVPRRSESYHYLDTPVGRLVVNVCRDIRSDVPMILNRVLGAAGVLVPAFSKRLDFALEEARVLGARQGAFVFVVNPWCGEVRDAACVYAPIKGGFSGVLVGGPNIGHAGCRTRVYVPGFDWAWPGRATGCGLGTDPVRCASNGQRRGL